MKYVSKKVDFSPILHNKDEAVAKCIRHMKGKGYRLATEADVGISWAVLIFETA